MLSPLILFLLLLVVFITPGASLKCEVCEGIGHNCAGEMHECPSTSDSCAIVMTETTVGIKMNAIVKTCLPSSMCNKDPIVINMGEVGTMSTQALCCTGDMCKKITPTMPPRQTKPNGKVCPGCYSLHHLECQIIEEVQCAADENYCLDVSGTTNLGGLTLTTVVKGCSNKDACVEMRDHSQSFSGISVVASSNCTLAPSKGGIHSRTEHSSMPDPAKDSAFSHTEPRNFTVLLGLLLLTLSKLLLVDCPSLILSVGQ